MGLYKVIGPIHKIRSKVGDGLIQDTGLMQGSLQYLCQMESSLHVAKTGYSTEDK